MLDPTFKAAKLVSVSHRRVEIQEALAAVYSSEPAAVDPIIDHLQAEALCEEW